MLRRRRIVGIVFDRVQVLLMSMRVVMAVYVDGIGSIVRESVATR